MFAGAEADVVSPSFVSLPSMMPGLLVSSKTSTRAFPIRGSTEAKPQTPSAGVLSMQTMPVRFNRQVRPKLTPLTGAVTDRGFVPVLSRFNGSIVVTV